MSGVYAKKMSKKFQFFKRTWSFPVAVIVAFFLVWSLIYAPWDSPAAPAWVQAIGSVAAIFTAVGISWWQNLESRRASSDAAFEYMRRAHSECRGMGGSIKVVSILNFGGAVPREYLPGAIRALRATFERVNMFNPIEMIDDDYAGSWQHYSISTRHFIEDLELDLVGENEAVRHDLDDHLKILEFALDWLEKDFKEVLFKHGKKY